MNTEAIKSLPSDVPAAGARAGGQKKSRGAGKSAQPQTDAPGVYVEVGYGAHMPQARGYPADRQAQTRGETDADACARAEALAAAINVFVEAYNRLLDALAGAEASKPRAEALREAVYGPVTLTRTPPARQISLYEIGVAHAPNAADSRFRSAESEDPPAGDSIRRDTPPYPQTGRLTIHEKKLTAALRTREAEIRILFADGREGLLCRLLSLLETPAETNAESDIREFKTVCENLKEAVTRCATL